MEKVLVTGANGLLGANIVRQLNNLEYLPKAMTRRSSNKLSLKGARYELFEGEITNEKDVFEAVSDCDYVIHSAARTITTPSNLEAYKVPNITATKILIKASRYYKIKRFIFVSTANCFTNGTINKPGNERGGFMPWLKASGYAYSKFLAQEEVMMDVRKHGFPAIIVNPTFMIGANDSKPSSGKLLLYGYKKKIVFYPTGGKNFVNVEYAADAICRALTKGELGESYLLAGKNMSYKDFFIQVAKQTGKRKILIPIPSAILVLIGRFSDLFEKLFSVSLPLSTANAKLLNLDNYFTNKKAMLGLDMKNTEIEVAVKNAIDWFKQNGHLKYD